MYADSHVHMWELARGDYTWIPPGDPVIARDYVPAELLPALERNHVTAVILVQAAATVAETDYMLSLAGQYPWITGVVGGMSLLADDFDQEYDRLRQNRRFAGIRINGTDIPDAGSEAWNLLLSRLSRLEADGLTLDVLAHAVHLESIALLLPELPDLTAVINHLGIPGVKDGAWEPWNAGVSLLAGLPGAAFKISGMLTQAGGYRPELLYRYVHRLCGAVGPERVLFGSDWPVALLGGTYDEAVALFEAVLPPEWGERERGLARCGNALRIYGA
ncbi:amidohydrolase family protein [Paenibacillus nasutitermitis]|uniref:Amidohydrolase n=1 Tax=Paenibacillus nasutitermitis TaxID=1652958 RepID=A0A917DZ58_9BACL|nr:amidohydrolase family protein [Paenibacillus nasutitermitis]GGD81384.1 amidohydrolase [Paenibacillus nasutitermitis]